MTSKQARPARCPCGSWAWDIDPLALGKKVEAAEFLTIDFYQVGMHENFYAALKRYLREGGMEP